MSGVKQEAAGEEEEEGGLGALRDLVGLLLRAPRRHPRVFFLVLVVVLGVTGAAAALMPRQYQVDCKILAQKNLVIGALLNPHRPIDGNADAPTKAVADVILKRDNLIAVIKDANLMDVWDSQRPPLMKWKEKLTRAIGGPPSDEDKMRALLGVLEQKLVITTDDLSIKLELTWENPQMAYQLITLLLRNFLDGRNAIELSAIAETITILEDESKKSGDEVDASLAELRQAKAKAVAAASVGLPKDPKDLKPSPNPSPNPNPSPGPAPVVNDAKPKLAAALAAKRKEIRDLDEPRQKRLADLRVELAKLKEQFAPAHPSVIALEQKIAAESVEPPELVKLKQEEQDLIAQEEDLPSEYHETGSGVAKPAPKPLPKPVVAATAPLAPTPDIDDPDVAQARARLTAATHKYQEILDRIDTARIEMHTAQAAFKYRYSVTQPPEQPKKPKKPNVPMIIIAGVFLSALFGILAAAARDLSSGKFVEPWQVDRRLKLPVLAKVRLR